MNYYLVGIKGSGMAGLAQILFDLGHVVKGSDTTNYVFTEEKLKEKGIEIEKLDNMNYKDSDVIIVGNSFIGKYDFKDKNVMSYQEVLSSLNDNYYSIAVCGTHGKTTTTNMIKHVLSFVYETSYLIGDGQGKAHPNGNIFIYEACEHRDHFLKYHPNIIVCTNIDYDHVEYFTSKKQYKTAFRNFFNQCKDLLILNDAIDIKSEKMITYGLNNGFIKAKNIKYKENGCYFDLLYKNKLHTNLFVPFYGKHMLLNALSCVSCCLYLNIDIVTIIKQLQTYKEAGRRYNITFVKNNVIIDDYGHHPKEINVTIDAIKQEFPSKKIVIVYHPDRPKRLSTFLEKYKKVFYLSEKTFVLPFLTMDIEKKQALEKLIDNKKIYLFDDTFFQKDFSNYVFLFTGSKDMKSLISKLIYTLKKVDKLN